MTMNIIKIIKGWIYKIKHFDALEKECRTLKSELNEIIRLNYHASIHSMLKNDYNNLLNKYDFTCKTLSDTQRNYQKVCKEKRHLEKEIELLKKYEV